VNPSNRAAISAVVRMLSWPATRLRYADSPMAAKSGSVSRHAWEMTRKLPGAMASRSEPTIFAGSSESGMKCSTAASSTATGREKSMSVRMTWSATILAGSRRSAWMTAASGLPSRMSLLCATATSSLST